MKLSLPLILACAEAYIVSNSKRMEDVESSGNSLSNATNNEIDQGVMTNGSGPVTTEDSSNRKNYIVVLKSGESEEKYEEHNSQVLEQIHSLRKREDETNSTDASGDVIESFNISSLHGYIAELPSSVLETIKQDPLVDFIEEDSQTVGTDFVTQINAPWNLARISHRGPTQPPATDYRYDTEGGKGVTAYVLDTGIQTTNPEFEGRASYGINYEEPSVTTDLDGHGTHVAGVLGSKTYGVAKQVELVSVGVLDRNKRGTVSSFVKGMDYVVREHRRKIRAKRRDYKGAIINISVASLGASRVFDQATEAAVDAGVHVVVSAGNDDQDACNSSPARVPKAITVGSTDRSDTKARTSNWGKCVDIQAPGIEIPSVGLTSSPSVKSGTSFAAPNVSGVLAYLLSLQPDRGSTPLGKRVVTPRELREILMKLAIHGVVHGLDSVTPNVFVYNGSRETAVNVSELLDGEQESSPDS